MNKQAHQTTKSFTSTARGWRTWVSVGSVVLLMASSAHAHNACVQAIVDKYVPAAPNSNVPGVGVAVIGGDTSDLYVFGKSDLASGAPFAVNSVVQIASNTKPFTSTLIREYAVDSVVNVNASVNTYLPIAYRVPNPSALASITLEMLISYTSGLTREDSATSLNTLYSEFDNTTLLFTPGLSAAYSNFGFNLAGRLMESHLDIAYEDQVLDNVIAPLGMPDTNFNQSENTANRLNGSQLLRRAKGYNCTSTGCTDYKLGTTDGPWYNPAGGLASTTQDMAQWLRAQVGAMTMPASLASAIAATHNSPDAWGTSASEKVPSGWYYKGGTLPGFESAVAFNPSQHQGVFIVGNSSQFQAEPIAFEIAAALNDSSCFQCRAGFMYCPASDSCLTPVECANYGTIGGGCPPTVCQ